MFVKTSKAECILLLVLNTHDRRSIPPRQLVADECYAAAAHSVCPVDYSNYFLRAVSPHCPKIRQLEIELLGKEFFWETDGSSSVAMDTAGNCLLKTYFLGLRAAI